MARLKEIVVDSAQPAALARFWAAALDGYAVRAYDDAEIARLAAIGRTPETDPSVMIDGPGPTFCFHEVTVLPPGRSKWHIDIVGAPRAQEIDRLIALGARVRDAHDGYTVMLDPEGNAFCVQDPNTKDTP